MARGGSKPSAARLSGSSKAVKGKASGKIKAQEAESPSTTITNDLQQRCLNIFRDTLSPNTNDSTTLQEVKGHLYNRDFAAAFGKEEYLRAYASRWSPSRALAYLEIFDALTGDIIPLGSADEVDSKKSTFSVVCLGGGAGGELVALAGWLNARLNQSTTGCMEKLHVTLIDIADWNQVIIDLHNRIISPPELSKYASQAKRDANTAMIESDQLSVKFQQRDVLNSDEDTMSTLLADADLITFMFTLNELYSTSMPKTQQLISTTLGSMRAGGHLLVVDSPGSYSTVSINGAAKRYPMQWLLHYTLLGDARKQDDGESSKWQQLTTDDSRWFRLPEGLQYPIELENMRYQLHLYRRKSDSGERSNHSGTSE